jgi:hypothetical protein
MIKKIRISIIFLSMLSFILTSCVQTIPPEALVFNKDTLANRQLQTRKFDTKTEKELLSAASSVLQDMGYNLDESTPAVGVLVGSKNRDATDTGQVVAAVVLAVMFGSNMPIDKEQKIRASLITRPSETGKGHLLRVTFQRIVWNTQGAVSKIEPINDALIYQEFFDKLSKSVFLEAQKI